MIKPTVVHAGHTVQLKHLMIELASRAKEFFKHFFLLQTQLLVVIVLRASLMVAMGDKLQPPECGSNTLELFQVVTMVMGNYVLTTRCLSVPIT